MAGPEATATTRESVIQELHESLLWQQPWVNLAQVETMTGIAYATLGDAIRDGELQARKRKGKWFVQPAALADWIDGGQDNGFDGITPERKAEIRATAGRLYGKARKAS